LIYRPLVQLLIVGKGYPELTFEVSGKAIQIAGANALRAGLPKWLSVVVHGENPFFADGCLLIQIARGL